MSRKNNEKQIHFHVRRTSPFDFISEDFLMIYYPVEEYDTMEMDIKEFYEKYNLQKYNVSFRPKIIICSFSFKTTNDLNCIVNLLTKNNYISMTDRDVLKSLF